ncbi:hypothetical protein [Superficieibacter sp. 1612_C1]|uniref:hypothetical protein n=1 Tax=Superficieibacter sp. 1612_C1 TaxID=2780382 RepID=UPI00188369EE|nr:hypothetical protein [Superficieibacter sp. 1612_C1]
MITLSVYAERQSLRLPAGWRFAYPAYGWIIRLCACLPGGASLTRPTDGLSAFAPACRVALRLPGLRMDYPSLRLPAGWRFAYPAYGWIIRLCACLPGGASLTRPTDGLSVVAPACRVALRLPGLRMDYPPLRLPAGWRFAYPAYGWIIRRCACLPGGASLTRPTDGLSAFAPACRVALRLPGLRMDYPSLRLPAGWRFAYPAYGWIIRLCACLPGGASLTRPTDGLSVVAPACRVAASPYPAWEGLPVVMD